MLILGIILCLALLAIGSPLFVAFSIGSAIAIIFYLGFPLQSIAQYFFASVNIFGLIAVPFFILAGNLVGEGGVSAVIIDAANALIGRVRGGMGVALTAACGMFGSMSGSNLATAVTMGTVAVPSMTKLGYGKRFSAALTATSSHLGELIPPSIAAILYGMVTERAVGKLFMAGIFPGLVAICMLSIVTIVRSRRRGYGGEVTLSWGERRRILVKVLPAGLIPAVILGGIYGGIFTPTEAAMVACLVTVILGFFVYRKLHLTNMWKAIVRGVTVSGNIYFIVGGSCLIGMLLTLAQVPQTFTSAVMAWGLTPVTFCLFSWLILVVLGMVLNATPLILVTMPVFMPAMDALGVNYYMFYVIVVLACGVGQITPPVATILYVISDLVHEPPLGILKEVYPWTITWIVMGVIVILFPSLATFIPSLM